MVIYGVAVLAICHLVGVIFGEWLGVVLGVRSNVGGVGFAMLLLIFATDWMRRTGRLPAPTEGGVLFWSSMYIPIVVAMAMLQNVVAAVSGGAIAVVAGVGAVVISLALVPILARIGGREPPLPKLSQGEASR